MEVIKNIFAACENPKSFVRCSRDYVKKFFNVFLMTTITVKYGLNLK